MKKNSIKTFGQYIKESREFNSHREEGPVYTFFERIPGIGIVELGIVYSVDDDEQGEVYQIDGFDTGMRPDMRKYSDDEITEIENYTEENEREIFNEVVKANRDRGIRTILPE